MKSKDCGSHCVLHGTICLPAVTSQMNSHASGVAGEADGLKVHISMLPAETWGPTADLLIAENHLNRSINLLRLLSAGWQRSTDKCTGYVSVGRWTIKPDSINHCAGIHWLAFFRD